MRRATFLTSARADLLAIFIYIAEASGSISAGARFVRRIRARSHELAALDGTLGRARPELRDDIRSFPDKGYVIFFRYAAHHFEIVNILDGHRDIDAHFDDNETP